MNASNIVIYQSEDGVVKLETKLEEDTIWLTQQMMVELFQSSKANISEHISNIFDEEELEENSVVRNFRTTASDGKSYNTKYYNLDMIISVGYRVKSKTATQFRRWATQTLKEFLVKGYAANEQRLKENESRLQALKTAISLIERGANNQIEDLSQARSLTGFLKDFADGLALLDDYDHELLDKSGASTKNARVIEPEEFLNVVQSMKQNFASDVFGVPKDESFESSVRQIYQSFGGSDCYPTLEEKAAMLLYLVVKNHSFTDGNKRIAASCFLYFLEKNDLLRAENGAAAIDNNALFALTILVAESAPSEMEIMKNIIVTILNKARKSQ